jgi:Ca2+-binding RTX toxin-like protein
VHQVANLLTKVLSMQTISALNPFKAIYVGAGDDRVFQPVRPSINQLSFINAGDGRNVIRSGSQENIIYGGTDDDLIQTGAGNDRLFAGGGQNIISSGTGLDIVCTDIQQSDRFYLSQGEGFVTIYGADRSDRFVIDAKLNLADIRVTIQAGDTVISSAAGDRLAVLSAVEFTQLNFESVSTASFANLVPH